MSVTARIYTLISADEYLAADNDGQWRHEFVDGAVYAMSGASARHGLIRGNALMLLMSNAPAGCQVFSAELKLRVKANDTERYYYPDVFVSCDPADREAYFRNSASLIVEILSPSTERLDRTEKFEAYKRNSALVEYVLLSQNARELEIFRRRTGWQRELFLGESTVTLESIGLTLSVASFYRHVGLDDDETVAPAK